MEILNYVTQSIIFSLLGIIILVASFYVIEKVTPENMWKKIVEEKNTAIAIVAAAYIIAIAMIISASIH